MITPVLVRHPRPFQTESVRGYVLRLSEANGYHSPACIFQLAGMHQCETSTYSFNFAKLARVANFTLSLFDNQDDRSNNIDIPISNVADGTFILPRGWTTGERFCVRCVLEKGFIEAHWDFPLMVACPIHRCMAVFRCPGCGESITFRRRGLLVCKCKQDLSKVPESTIPSSMATLLDIVRNSILNGTLSAGNPAKLPVEDLLRLDLDTLSIVIRTLGRHKLLAGHKEGTRDDRSIVPAASTVLRQWPENFMVLLRHYTQARQHHSTRNLVSTLNKKYRILFNNPAIRPPKQTEFLRLPYLEYLGAELGYADPARLEKYWDRLPTGLVTSKFNRLRNRAVREDKARVVDMACMSVRFKRERVSPLNVGGYFPAPEDTNGLGLPEDVRRALRAREIADVPICAAPNPCSSSGTLNHLDQLFLDLTVAVPRNPQPVRKTIALGVAMNWPLDPPVVRAEVAKAVLEHRLPVLGCIDGTVSGLLLDDISYRKIRNAARFCERHMICSAREAAGYLACGVDAISGLLKAGRIRGFDSPHGLRIECDSIKAFIEEYVFVATVAKNEHTNSPRVIRHCNWEKIQLMRAGPKKNSARNLFVRKTDVERLTTKLRNRASQTLRLNTLEVNY